MSLARLPVNCSLDQVAGFYQACFAADAWFIEEFLEVLERAGALPSDWRKLIDVVPESYDSTFRDDKHLLDGFYARDKSVSLREGYLRSFGRYYAAADVYSLIRDASSLPASVWNMPAERQGPRCAIGVVGSRQGQPRWRDDASAATPHLKMVKVQRGDIELDCLVFLFNPATACIMTFSRALDITMDRSHPRYADACAFVDARMKRIAESSAKLEEGLRKLASTPSWRSRCGREDRGPDYAALADTVAEKARDVAAVHSVAQVFRPQQQLVLGYGVPLPSFGSRAMPSASSDIPGSS
jgi:hypothetical protein